MRLDIVDLAGSLGFYANQLMNKIQSYGYESYIVGGAVRDIVMGSSHIHDIDIATNMPMDEIKSKFTAYEYGGGEKHGTLIVKWQGGCTFELTQFRTEGTYTDGRRPDSVEFTSSFEEDVKRRDFTINAMGIDANGNLIDYHNGQSDLINRVLNTVGDPLERFNEDGLRMVRAIRFAAKLGFRIEKDVFAAITTLRHLIDNISRERIRDELIKMSESQSFNRGIAYALHSGVFWHIFPTYFTGNRSVTSERFECLEDGSFEFCIAQLIYDFSAVDVKLLCDSLKLTVEQSNAIQFAVKHHDKLLYALLSMSRKDGYKLVSNKHFPLAVQLHKVTGPINSIIYDVVEYIKDFAIVDKQQKRVNKLLQDTNYFHGPAFGVAQNKIMNICYSIYEINRTIPSDDELKQIITLALDVDYTWDNML